MLAITLSILGVGLRFQARQLCWDRLEAATGHEAIDGSPGDGKLLDVGENFFFKAPKEVRIIQ
jgi:hypothetical protein